MKEATRIEADADFEDGYQPTRCCKLHKTECVVCCAFCTQGTVLFSPIPLDLAFFHIHTGRKTKGSGQVPPHDNPEVPEPGECSLERKRGLVRQVNTELFQTTEVARVGPFCTKAQTLPKVDQAPCWARLTLNNFTQPKDSVLFLMWVIFHSSAPRSVTRPPGLPPIPTDPSGQVILTSRHSWQ